MKTFVAGFKKAGPFVPTASGDDDQMDISELSESDEEDSDGIVGLPLEKAAMFASDCEDQEFDEFI